MPSRATGTMPPGKVAPVWGDARLPVLEPPSGAVEALSRLTAMLHASSGDELAPAWLAQAAERLPVRALHLALREERETRHWSSPGGSLTADAWLQVEAALDSGQTSVAAPNDGHAAAGARVVVPMAAGGRPFAALIAETVPREAIGVLTALEIVRWPLALRLGGPSVNVPREPATGAAAHGICEKMHDCDTLTDLLSLLLTAVPRLLQAEWATVATCDPQGRVLHVTSLDGPVHLGPKEWARAVETCVTDGRQGRAVPVPFDGDAGDSVVWALALCTAKTPLRYVLAVGGKAAAISCMVQPLLAQVAAHAEVSLARIVAAGELRLTLDVHGRVHRLTQLVTSQSHSEAPEHVLRAAMGAILQEAPGLTAVALHLWTGDEFVHEQGAGTVPAGMCHGDGLRWWQERLAESAALRRAMYWVLPAALDQDIVLIAMPILPGRTAGEDRPTLGVVSLFATSLETVDLVLRATISPFAHVIAQLVLNLQHYRALTRAHDELEQRKAQIIESKSALEAILDGFPDGLFIVDRDLRVTLSNGVQMHRAQWSRPAAGQYCWELYGSGDGVCAGCRVMDTLQKGISTRRRTRVCRPGQPEREWEIVAHPIARRSARSTQAALVLVRDVTEQEQVAKSLAQVEKLAAAGRLAAGIAHEINNPLAAIQANVQLLLGIATPHDEQYESLTIMWRSAERARRVVRNLLSFSEQALDDLSPVDANATIRAAVDLVAHQAAQRGVTLDCRLTETLPQVMASQDQLESVWLNLALNALDAVLEKGVDGRIEVTSEATPGGDIRVTFRDNGHGIPPHRLPHVFEPFGSSAAPTVGTGLGLYNCHSVVKRHGGSIRARAGEGGGALFEVLLPAIEGDGRPERAPAGDVVVEDGGEKAT